MLPAPFYSEVPPDLGDDETWRRQIVGGCGVDELMHRPRPCLHAALGDKVASRAVALVSLVRPWGGPVAEGRQVDLTRPRSLAPCSRRRVRCHGPSVSGAAGAESCGTYLAAQLAMMLAANRASAARVNK
jgi:hypothetical protein